MRTLTAAVACWFWLFCAPPAGAIALLTGNGVQCTAFSINETRGLWLTAGHCAAADTIDDAPAKVLTVALELDLALYEGPKRPAFRLGKPPKVGDGFTLRGFPGNPTPPVPLPFWGRISVPVIGFSTPQWVTLVHHGGEPGMSGAPILVKGKVVSVLLGALRYPSIQFGSTFADLKAFTAGRWQP